MTSKMASTGPVRSVVRSSSRGVAQMEERQTLDLDVTGSTPVSPATFPYEVWDAARSFVTMFLIHKRYYPHRMYNTYNMREEYRYWGKKSGSFQTRSGT